MVWCYNCIFHMYQFIAGFLIVSEFSGRNCCCYRSSDACLFISLICIDLAIEDICLHLQKKLSSCSSTGCYNFVIFNSEVFKYFYRCPKSEYNSFHRAPDHMRSFMFQCHSKVNAFCIRIIIWRSLATQIRKEYQSLASCWYRRRK